MQNYKKGSGIIEIIVGLSIVLVGIFALLKTYNYYLKFALIHKYDIAATLLAEEGVEAIKILRDSNFTSKIAALSSGTVYSLAFVNSFWESTTTRKYVDGIFDRTFLLNDVYREPTDDIGFSGTLDPNTKKVTVSVSYRGISGTSTKSISTYITNIFSN